MYYKIIFQKCQSQEFTFAGGKAEDGIAALWVKVDDDAIIASEEYDSYDEFVYDLREKVRLRPRNIYNVGWYKKIARDVVDWGGNKTCFEYVENRLNIMIEYNHLSGWWESYITYEESEKVPDNWDEVWFADILEQTKEEEREKHENRKDTEESLRKVA